METETARTDPASDLTPHVRKGYRPQNLIFLLVFGLGALLISLGVRERYVHHETWLPELTIALGVAIAAPGILSYLYRRYLLDDIKAELERPASLFRKRAVAVLESALNEVLKQHEERELDLIRNAHGFLSRYGDEMSLLNSAKKAGLYGLYHSRREALGAFLTFIKPEKHEIVIVGSSLRGLLHSPDREYELAREELHRKNADGVTLRFLLTHPLVGDMRARQENRPFGAIGREIIRSLQILLLDWKVNPDSIRLYKGTPTCFGLRTGQHMLLNAYPYMKEAFASPCFIAAKGGYLYDHYDNSHFQAWGSAVAEPVPVQLESLMSELPEYARRIGELMQFDTIAE